MHPVRMVLEKIMTPEREAEARALLRIALTYTEVAEESARQFDEQRNSDASLEIWERARGLNQRIRAWLAAEEGEDV